MTGEGELAGQVTAVVNAAWPDGDAKIIGYLVPKIIGFAQSGLADAHFMSQFGSGNVDQMLSRCWEALLFERFRRLGWGVTSSAAGPDFLLEIGEQRISLEAIALTPGAVATNPVLWEYVNRQPLQAFVVPIEEQLPRWTAAIRDKARRHTQHVKMVTQVLNSRLLSL